MARRTRDITVPLALLALVLGAATPAVAKKPQRRVDVLVVDLGIHAPSEEALRVRTLLQVLAPGIETKILHYRRVTIDRVQAMDPKSVVLAPTRGRWARFPKKKLDSLMKAVRAYRRSLLAIGGGHQLLARAWEAELRPMSDTEGEFGEGTVRLVKEDPLFAGLSGEIRVCQGHREEVAALPEGFVLLAESDLSPIQAMRHETRPHYGIQFHPEDPRCARLPARQILRNFLKLAGVVRGD